MTSTTTELPPDEEAMAELSLKDWRLVPSFPAFAVTSGGEVWRLKPGSRGIHAKKWPIKVKTLDTPRGSLMMMLSNGRKWKGHVWALVAEAFHGVPPGDPTVKIKFRDGNPMNASSGNLIIDTIAQGLEQMPAPKDSESLTE